MGKRLIIQRRGRGTPTYRSASHRFKGKIAYRYYDDVEKEGCLVGKVADIMHDPGRSAPVALVKFENGEKQFILAPESIQIDDEIACGISAPISPGNSLPLGQIPEGTPVYNLERHPGDGGKFVRSSGTHASLITHDVGKAIVELPSGELKAFNPQCRA
ncbi:MAG TPA: 50S ribosomal protein L2, partial [Methanobacteriaceae archaeon]|nr:50S ribosomal protein L2 [Methanobacteriaceae archaeon]